MITREIEDGIMRGEIKCVKAADEKDDFMIKVRNELQSFSRINCCIFAKRDNTFSATFSFGSENDLLKIIGVLRNSPLVFSSG